MVFGSCRECGSRAIKGSDLCLKCEEAAFEDDEFFVEPLDESVWKNKPKTRWVEDDDKEEYVEIR
jgi:hypothetical protein